AAYRVVQEALTNIHKHAPTAAATVRLAGAPGIGLEVRVENLAPRTAVTPLPGSGSGLAGLRERVQVAGGSFEAGQTLRGGFLVLAWLPWPETAAKTHRDVDTEDLRDDMTDPHCPESTELLYEPTGSYRPEPHEPAEPYASPEPPEPAEPHGPAEIPVAARATATAA
ncbi:MAG: hypothetical protein HOV87_27640, partial [Catenulispora sp.]|nr:hypothetical protein [Catenulispora sp.]